VSGPSRTIRLLVADDHPMFRASLVRAVAHQPDIAVVAEAGDGRAALEAIRAARPDIALLDLRMPELDGAAVLQAVTRDELPTKVMLLSGALDDAAVYTALERGAAAILPKTLEAQAVVDAIRAVARGDTVLAPELQAALASAIRARAVGDRAALTAREREILALMADGLSGPEIARRLHVSPSTVKSHSERLYEKLGVSERAAAVAEGMRRGELE
jgi:two-component system nitrate/nitrite response regulator NarL